MHTSVYASECAVRVANSARHECVCVWHQGRRSRARLQLSHPTRFSFLLGCPQRFSELLCVVSPPLLASSVTPCERICTVIPRSICSIQCRVWTKVTVRLAGQCVYVISREALSVIHTDATPSVCMCLYRPHIVPAVIQVACQQRTDAHNA